MRDDDEQLKIELLSQWKLEAESRKKPSKSTTLMTKTLEMEKSSS